MPPHEKTKKVVVWDLPTRVFHWALVGVILFLGISGELGRLDQHMIVGPAAIALVLFRLVWGVIGSQTARFAHFVKGPGAVLAYLRKPDAAAPAGHNPLGALSVLALLAIVAVQGLSGLFTSDDILTQGPLAHLLSSKDVSAISTVHRIGFKVMLGLIALHLAAIAFYRFVKKDDLIRPMITGEKQVPVSTTAPGTSKPLWAAIAAIFAAAAIWGGLHAIETAWPPPLF